MAKFIMEHIIEDHPWFYDSEEAKALTIIGSLAPECLKTGTRRKRVSDAFVLAMKGTGLSDLLGEL